MLRGCGPDRHPTPSNNRAARPEAFVCALAPGVYFVRGPETGDARLDAAVAKVVIAE